MKKILMAIVAIAMVLGMASPALGVTTKSIGTDSIKFTNSAFSSAAKVSPIRYSTNRGEVSLKIPDHAIKSYKAGTKPTMEIKIYAKSGLFGKHHVRTIYYHPASMNTRIYQMYVNAFPRNKSGHVELYAEYRSNYTTNTFKPNWRD